MIQQRQMTTDLIDAIILAGGKGTRLSSVIADRPKPMADVEGRPFIEWLIRQLRAQGVRRIILSTGHMAELFEAWFGSGRRLGVEIVYSREQEPLGTGGAMRLALQHAHSHVVLVMNGDSFCGFSLQDMLAAHKASNAKATLVLTDVPSTDRYGSVVVNEAGAVQAFREKQAGMGAGRINAGVYLLHRDVISAIPEHQAVSIEREVFPSLIGHGLHACVAEGPFIDIGTPESYRDAGDVLREALAPLRTDMDKPAMWARAQGHLRESAAIYTQLAEGSGDALLSAVDMLADCFRAGGKLMICGNGGSAADAQHLAAEFVSRLTQDFERPALPAISLATDSSFLTAYANDIGFEGVFARQVEALGRAGDVLLGISTSGNSANVMRAVEKARRQNIRTLGLLGEGGALTAMVDCALVVPSRKTQYVQEASLALYHLLCDLTERRLFG
jgi:phosphoheptose isomerase